MTSARLEFRSPVEMPLLRLAEAGHVPSAPSPYFLTQEADRSIPPPFQAVPVHLPDFSPLPPFLCLFLWKILSFILTLTPFSMHISMSGAQPSCFEASEWPVKAAAEMKVAEPLTARRHGASRSLTRESANCHPVPCFRDGCWSGRRDAAQTWGQLTSQQPRMKAPAVWWTLVRRRVRRNGRVTTERSPASPPPPHWEVLAEARRKAQMRRPRPHKILENRACGLDCSSFRACSEGPGCTPAPMCGWRLPPRGLPGGASSELETVCESHNHHRGRSSEWCLSPEKPRSLTFLHP